MEERVRTASNKPDVRKSNLIIKNQKTGFSQSNNSPVNQILHLQRTVGNHAVQGMFKFGVIQAKLRIGRPNDIYEQEADRVAEQVTRIPEPNVQQQPEEEEEEEEEELIQTKPLAELITTLVQRQVEEEEEEEIQTKLFSDQVNFSIQRQIEEEEEEVLQPQGNTGKTPEVTSDLESRIHSLKGGGQPLPVPSRNFFEPRFGYDLSQVRIHNDARAAEAAQAVNARAFTVGRNIVFGTGQHSLEAPEGRRLLAHELTHVVQQSANMIQRISITRDAHSRQIKVTPTMAISPAFIQARLRRGPASRIIPDLDAATVEEIKSPIRFGISKKIRQELIDFIVQDRQRKGVNFQIMEKGKPIYVDVYPEWITKEHRQSNGITVPPGQDPGCPGSEPCVFIGPQAFGGENVEQRMVRLYSTITHEYQHAKQWQEPTKARALGKAGREVEAFFWEIENSKRTGLFGQRGPFKNVWDEAKGHWQAFKVSQEWQNLKNEEKQRYIDWFKRVSKIARQVLGPK